MMKGSKHLVSVLLLIIVSIGSENLNAQLIRFEVNVEKRPAGSEAPIYFRGESRDENKGITDSKADSGRSNIFLNSGCLVVASRENIRVLVRASMNEQTADRIPTITPRYINNGSGCPDNAKRLYEVSHPFSDGQANFHLNELQTTKRSTPGIKGEVVSYLTLMGYSTTGAWMKAGELNMDERDTGISFTIEIEYL